MKEVRLYPVGIKSATLEALPFDVQLRVCTEVNRGSMVIVEEAFEMLVRRRMNEDSVAELVGNVADMDYVEIDTGEEEVSLLPPDAKARILNEVLVRIEDESEEYACNT